VQSLCLRDGRRLCVRKWPGTGSDTLVLIHGLMDSSEGWSCLDDSVTCTRIAFDLPGFGYSDAPSLGSVQGYARDVADGLEMLGVTRFTLVGHSLGGAVATALAELMPERVNALVLLAPAGFGRIGLAEAASIPGVRNVVQAALPLALSSRLIVTASYRTMVSNGDEPQTAVIERVTARGRGLVAGAREGTRAIVDAGRSREAFHRRRVRYDGPVYAVWGDRDRLVPLAHRDGVRAAFPHAQVDVWQGMGHDAPRERVDQVTELLETAAAAGRRHGTQPAGRRARRQRSTVVAVRAVRGGPLVKRPLTTAG